MKLKDIQTDHLIEICPDDKHQNIYDVILHNVQQLKKLDSFECHFVLYPYSRDVVADSFSFHPFEEYANDIAKAQHSVYTPIADNSGKRFGVFVGLLIVAIFLIFNPKNLANVEAIVSIIGAYALSKELWSDIQNGIERISQRFRVRYIERYYNFALERRTTLSRYASFARKQRVGKATLLPSRMAFIEQSNSQTLRMGFNKFDFEKITDDSVHLCSVHIKNEKLNSFVSEGYLFGVKISLNKHFLGIRKSFEMFQSKNSDTMGCMNKDNKWVDNALFYRKTFNFKRIKYFFRDGILENKFLIR